MSEEIYQTAVEYTKEGWILHPLSSPSDQRYPNSAGKRVLVPKWSTRGTPLSDEELKKYFKQTNNNIGLLCGKASGVLVIDFDSDLFVSNILKGFEDKLVCSQHTKGRGHVFFKYTEAIRPQKHHLLGIEILSDGNNVVLPPSVHKSGGVYEWRGDWRNLPEMPKEVIDRLNKLFKIEKELNDFLRKSRHCFRHVLSVQPDLHGADGREFMLALCTDLKAKGATEDHIKMLAKLIYKKDYDERKTLDEFRNIDPSKTWRCETLRDKCAMYVDLSHCNECEKKNNNNNNSKDNSKMRFKRRKQQFSEDIKKKAINILKNDNPLEYIKKVAQKVHIGDEKIIQILYCAAVSPELNSMHVMTVGRSGSGKSDCCDVVIEMLPSEFSFVVDDLSDKSLFYLAKEGYDFDGCVLYVDDVKMDNIDTLKTITTNARHRPRHITVKDQKALDLELNGNFSVWVSTVSPIQDEGGQISRRFLFLNPDESPEQDARVIEFIKNQRRKGISKRTMPEEFEIIKCMTQMIKEDNHKILCPINYKFPHTSQRYNIELFHNLIETITKINGKQRIEYCGHYLVEPEDLSIAFDLWTEFEELQILKIDKKAQAVFEVLPDEMYSYDEDTDTEENRCTVKDISSKTGIPPRTVHRKLKVLWEADLIGSTQAIGKGKPYSYWKFLSMTSVSHITKRFDTEKNTILDFFSSMSPCHEQKKKTNAPIDVRDIVNKYLSKIDKFCQRNSSNNETHSTKNDEGVKETPLATKVNLANNDIEDDIIKNDPKHKTNNSTHDNIMLKTYQQKMEILDTEYAKYKGDLDKFHDIVYKKFYEPHNISRELCSADVQEYLKVWRKDKTQEDATNKKDNKDIKEGTDQKSKEDEDILIPFRTTGNNLLKKSFYVIELVESGKSPKEATELLNVGIARGILEDKGDGYIYCWVNK